MSAAGEISDEGQGTDRIDGSACPRSPRRGLFSVRVDLIIAGPLQESRLPVPPTPRGHSLTVVQHHPRSPLAELWLWLRAGPTLGIGTDVNDGNLTYTALTSNIRSCSHTVSAL